MYELQARIGTLWRTCASYRATGSYIDVVSHHFSRFCLQGVQKQSPCTTPHSTPPIPNMIWKRALLRYSFQRPRGTQFSHGMQVWRGTSWHHDRNREAQLHLRHSGSNLSLEEQNTERLRFEQAGGYLLLARQDARHPGAALARAFDVEGAVDDAGCPRRGTGFPRR